MLALALHAVQNTASVANLADLHRVRGAGHINGENALLSGAVSDNAAIIAGIIPGEAHLGEYPGQSFQGKHGRAPLRCEGQFPGIGVVGNVADAASDGIPECLAVSAAFRPENHGAEVEAGFPAFAGNLDPGEKFLKLLVGYVSGKLDYVFCVQNHLLFAGADTPSFSYGMAFSHERKHQLSFQVIK